MICVGPWLPWEKNESFEPVGFWIDKGWKEIKKDLEDRLDYKRLEILFSDGGPGIEETLLEEGMLHQRCILHGKRDFSYILYADGFKKAEQAPLREKLETIPVFHFNQAKLEQLGPEDLPRVKDLAEKTKQGFQEMVDLLDPEKYPRGPDIRRESLSQYSHLPLLVVGEKKLDSSKHQCDRVCL